MKKFIFTMSVVWVAFYALLWLASKMINYSNHQEYLSFIEEIDRDNGELGI